MSGFEPIRYHHGEVALAGRLIRPAGPARAGIVIYPTIINGSARIEQAARDLAASGYLAFIADFYGEIPADFDAAWAAETMDNRSLIFGRRGNSWHGVRAIECPEGALRKVFIVVFEDYRRSRMLVKRVTRLLKGKPLVSEKELGMY